ncbi:MAG: site-specific DNA-methyltransferase [Bacteroidetes bacterium]|nr:site-specific DNA-methyltransferase [Bacteroidota bacterium]
MSPVKSKIPKEERPFLDRLLDEIRYRISGVEDIDVAGQSIPRYTGEFWTAKQRQAHALHEISYRACFKPQLPHFFIEHLTKEADRIYDPFSGRGTTVLEAGFMGRNVAANDINPLSTLLSRPRFFPPLLKELMERLDSIPISETESADIDLSMFFHPKTEAEIVSIKNYLTARHESGEEDDIDRWIRMVATNRLTGHSKGFFSVYTLPPNQAVSADSQKKINIKMKQTPEHRDTRVIIYKKSRTLLNDITPEEHKYLRQAGEGARFLTCDARETKTIESGSIQLTVTSPPFLDVVDYMQDNWLRCWFNGLDAEEISKTITIARTLESWSAVMLGVFRELYRITKPRGFVAFEVGEIRNKQINLDEHVVPLGIKTGFKCIGIIVNEQYFTKTSNIWGIDNNEKGTNSNRIVLFRK